MQAVITASGMCNLRLRLLLVVLRLAPGLGALSSLRCNLSQVCFNLRLNELESLLELELELAHLTTITAQKPVAYAIEI